MYPGPSRNPRLRWFTNGLWLLNLPKIRFFAKFCAEKKRRIFEQTKGSFVQIHPRSDFVQMDG